ncbi:EAL domain-containing protein [Vibrio sp. 10N.222.52.B7]|uniref:EAL domain-containing protein n=1 Tax=Vibrio sp. 10N.222.52.B7 TaxID=3229629 RepID=UPI00354C192B
MTIVTSKKRPTVGIVLPMLSGFYMGELNATLRRLAKNHKVNLIFIRSGERKDFKLPIYFNHLDALVVVLHAATVKLIEEAINANIPVISIGASYAPLPVEQYYSVQSDGVTKLYEWLQSQGHEEIGFCGDLTVNDIRSRFKAYQRTVIDHKGSFNQRHFFRVSNCSLSGGREAAIEFIQRKSKCTAVICATDHNAVGMMEQLSHSNISVPDDVAIVGIDNIFVGQQFNPKLTTVDQQLELLATQVFHRVLERISGKPFNNANNSVPQKLIVHQSCGNTNPDLEHKEDINSTRQILLNVQGRSPAEIFENFYSQAQGGFDSIRDAQSLYGNNLDWACLAECNSEQYTIRKWVEKGMTQPTTLPQQTDIQDDIRNFPFFERYDHFVASILPINSGQEDHWKLVAVVDSLQDHQDIGTQSVFNNYLDMLALFIERDELINTSNNRQKNSQQLLQQLKVVSNSSNDGIWDWDLLTNTLVWNSRLTKMIGCQDTFSDRKLGCDHLFQYIHSEDLELLESAIHNHLNEEVPFKCEFRMKTQHRGYIWVHANGSAVHNAEGQAVRFIGSMTDVTQEREDAEKIQHMAYYDALTGIANRRKIMESIAQHIVNRPNQKRAVMLMDLNRFKIINDSFGHHVGDALLCHVTKHIQNVLSSEHLVARLGGDEFLFLCNVSSEADINALATQILNAVQNPLIVDDIEIISQGSLGIAMYPYDGVSAEELIKQADIAMYQAKKLGGQSYLNFQRSMAKETENIIEIEHQLSRAIAQQEIKVHYQPQYCGQDEKITAVEALARWESPTLGDVPPDQFIEVAESAGLISKLGECIIHRVCKDVEGSEWLQTMSHISINISAKQLIQPHFAQEIIRTIRQYQLPLTLFCIEITESAAIVDYELCINSLKELHDVGISISLDDFGTGFSSLSLLKQLPLSEVKIDRSFISDITQGQTNLDFVNTMIMMGKSLGYRVVAEGVETADHNQRLNGLGIDLLQGYYFSKPRPLSELESEVAIKLTRA